MIRHVSCWCFAVAATVEVQGVVVLRRAGEVLKIEGCRAVGCGKRGGSECLVGKFLEGRW